MNNEKERLRLLSKLCYYDLRNPDGIIFAKDNPENYGYDSEDFKNYGNFSQVDCGCDNCFYGRSELVNQIILLEDRLKE